MRHSTFTLMLLTLLLFSLYNNLPFYDFSTNDTQTVMIENDLKEVNEVDDETILLQNSLGFSFHDTIKTYLYHHDIFETINFNPPLKPPIC